MRKIALLSNTTVDFIAAKLRKKTDVFIPSGFNTWQMEVLNPMSELYCKEMSAIFILLYADPYEDIWQSREKAYNALEEWEHSLETIAARLPKTPVFVSSIDLVGYDRNPVRTSGILAAEIEISWIKRIQKFNNNKVYLLPVKELILEEGRKLFYDRKIWYLGNCPYSIKACALIANLIGEHLCCAFEPRKKCIALDLDGTLWGGVIGEDGINGIKLSNHKEGARYYDMQKCLLDLKNKGVMLAIISKNNREDVEKVFAEHPFMVLKAEDFVAKEINWEPKNINIMRIAEKLNIGTEAIVFLDDNPAERANMAANCPEVTVLDFSKDTSSLPELITETYRKFFKQTDLTNEDIIKTEQYQQNIKRNELKSKAASYDDYLKNLDIKVDIHLMQDEESARTVQLINKTNQFNLTTRRYTEQDISQFIEDPNSEVIVAKMKDRFGDEGLIAVIVIEYQQNTAAIIEFLMSCRVMGRKLESCILFELSKYIKNTHLGITDIKGEFIKTAKNKPVEFLYDNEHFELVAEEGKPDEIGYKKFYQTSIKTPRFDTALYKEIKAF